MIIKKLILAILIQIITLQVYGQAPHFGFDPDPKAKNVPSSIKRNVKKAPGKYLDDLVDYLIKKSKDDFQKVKMIHDWIALNISYDVDGYLGYSTVYYSFDDVIKKGKSVCEGYSSVFFKMCELAGIECVKIHGYGRGLGFDPINPKEKYASNHAWNAVKIDNKWYLIDTTWDAGYVNGKKFIWSYGTGYLFLAPEKFINTHFPENPDWQLLDQPVSFKKFTKAPYLRDRFFNHRLELISDIQLLEKTDHKSRIIIKAPEEILAMATLYNKNNAELSNRTFVQRDGENIFIDCTFPSAGKYCLWLFTKRDSEEGQYWGAAQFSFKASEGTSNVFCLAYQSYYNKKCVIISPVFSPLKIGTEVSFKVKVPGESGVGVNNGKKYVNLTKNENGYFTGKIKIIGNEIFLYYEKGNRYEYIVKWTAK